MSVSAGARMGRMSVFFRDVRRLWGDRKGIAAVEFALIAPLLLALYFVTMELSLGIETNRKVGRIGSMVADLITQQPGSIKKADLESIMQLDQALIQPYSRSKPKIVVTAIKITDEATPRVLVDWSRQVANGLFSEPYAKNSTTAVPEQLKIRNTFVIRVESGLDYRPLITWSAAQKSPLGLTAAFDRIAMKDTYYLRPRMSPNITCGDC